MMKATIDSYKVTRKQQFGKFTIAAAIRYNGSLYPVAVEAYLDFDKETRRNVAWGLEDFRYLSKPERKSEVRDNAFMSAIKSVDFKLYEYNI